MESIIGDKTRRLRTRLGISADGVRRELLGFLQASPKMTFAIRAHAFDGREAASLTALGQNHGFRQVHQPRRTSSFFFVAMVGWCTRRQVTLWLKAWWCVLAHANVLQCVLHLVSKHRIRLCRRVARSLTRKGVLNPGARSYEKHKPGG